MEERFTVIFFDDDKKTILEKQEVEKGSKVFYTGEKPSKHDENGISFEFVGWELEEIGDLNNVTQDMKLYAKYESSKKNEITLGSIDSSTEMQNYNDVLNSGKKLEQVERALKDMSLEEKNALKDQIMENGYVELDNQQEQDR